ncbi:hypothetical protein IBHPHPPA_00001 [Salmonella phage KKP 3828]|uniref:Uncharacterized protein n=1 Tax=Salmonella phage KKP 3828 TaxID=3041358 RepID=A0AA50IHK2_9CAUD|nr:hypothetical protein IBHPHPPA_00001 [Salmonella phage KKP 3828]
MQALKLVRKQRRVGGKKQNYWVDACTGKEYMQKPERKRRTDRKAVSQNNVVTVALRLLAENELALVTMLDAVYADTGSVETLEQLTLIAATKDALSELVFLAGFCQPSRRFYSERSELALKLGYKFIMEFFPAEIENVDNLNAGTFRTRRVRREYPNLDDGDDTGYNFRMASKAYVDSIKV